LNQIKIKTNQSEQKQPKYIMNNRDRAILEDLRRQGIDIRGNQPPCIIRGDGKTGLNTNGAALFDNNGFTKEVEEAIKNRSLQSDNRNSYNHP